jgi:hypothetical protein
MSETNKSTQTNTKGKRLNFDDWCHELVTSVDVSDILPATIHHDSDAGTFDSDTIPSLSLSLDRM